MKKKKSAQQNSFCYCWFGIVLSGGKKTNTLDNVFKRSHYICNILFCKEIIISPTTEASGSFKMPDKINLS